MILRDGCRQAELTSESHSPPSCRSAEQSSAAAGPEARLRSGLRFRIFGNSVLEGRMSPGTGFAVPRKNLPPGKRGSKC